MSFTTQWQWPLGSSRSQTDVLVDCRCWCLVGGKESRWRVSRSGGLSLFFRNDFSEPLVSSLFVQQDVSRATGQPSSCAFEGQCAPRSPDPRTNDENTGLNNTESTTQYEDRSNAEIADLQNCGEEGRLCRP